VDLHVAALAELHDVPQELRVRGVADVDEHAVGRNDRLASVDHVAGADGADHVVLADDLVDDGIPHPAHLRVGERPFLGRFVRPELVATMDHDDLVGELGEEHPLLDRGVAAADHHDLLAAVEEAVAGGAGRDATTVERVLARYAQASRIRSRRQNHRPCPIVGLVAVHDEPVVGVPGQPLDLLHHDARAELLGLLDHALRQLRARDGLVETGVVLDLFGLGDLAAGQAFLEDEGVELPSTRVDARGKAGGSSTDDRYVRRDRLPCHEASFDCRAC